MKSKNISCVFLDSNLKQMDLYQELSGQADKQKKINKRPLLSNAPSNRRPSGIRKNLINVYSKHYGISECCGFIEDIRPLKQRRRDGLGTGFLIPSYFSRPQFPVADLVVRQMHS